MPNDTLEFNYIEDSSVVSNKYTLTVIDKFGNNGYAKEKCYFKDEEYEKFLRDIVELTNNKEEFRERYIKVNNL